MPVQNVGSLKGILDNYSAREWTQSFNLEDVKDLKPLTHHEIGGAKNDKSFSEMLTDSIANVNGLQMEANKAIENLATGRSKNLHETMLAVEKADIAFKAMNQVRMKVIDAYREIMRMQV
jgi:flagellar hook-basal body complex protein FliE